MSDTRPELEKSHDPLQIIKLVASVDDDEGREGRECYAFSEKEDRAFDLIRREAERLLSEHEIPQDRYSIETDAIGNLFITWHGKNPSKTVMSGSHVDSVKNGGKYDGVAGVNGAFNFLKLLAQAKSIPEYSYTFAVFRGEESSPTTGVTCLGSRIATGTITQAELQKIQYSLPGQPTESFKDHIEKTRDKGTWQKIIDEIQNPSITKDHIKSYAELHIEQSGVIDKNNADIGIVIDGIGSAIREELSVNIPTQTVEIGNDNPYEEFVLTFTGEEAHTGGTPSNPKLKLNYPQTTKTSPWYRKDAIVAGSQFLRLLLKAYGGKRKNDIKVLEFAPPSTTGYTTVPKEQRVRLAISKDSAKTFETLLASCKRRIEDETGVGIQYEKRETTSVSLLSFENTALQKALEIPVATEKYARRMVSEEGGVGKVRATVTDMAISEKGKITAKIDLRDVDPMDMEKLKNSIEGKIKRVGERLGTQTSVSLISSKPYTPIYSEGVNSLRSLAINMDLTYVELPSLPGHDGASLGKIDVPVNMIFIRHPGLSHSKDETMKEEDYVKAEKLYHQFLAQQLDISLQ